ncbi:MAG: hypothetical protein MUD10_02315 [Candidatus Pacebacteria bacterium]|jgi:hypothetical protein|nr:hypothetical protein [Candidatus Paceibacterota bacterium]
MLKIIFAAISLVLGFALFIPYCVGIWKKETKPHLLTWTTWFVLTGIGFYLSFTSGGGAGAWPFALQSILCLAVVVYALIKRERNIVRIDWIIFAFVVLVLIFYVFTKDALLSAVFAGLIDSMGYIPTFRKSYAHPFQEPPLTYSLSLASWLFSILALSNYSITTLVYPTMLVFVNGGLVIFLLVRRKALKPAS